MHYINYNYDKFTELKRYEAALLMELILNMDPKVGHAHFDINTTMKKLEVTKQTVYTSFKGLEAQEIIKTSGKRVFVDPNFVTMYKPTTKGYADARKVWESIDE